MGKERRIWKSEKKLGWNGTNFSLMLEFSKLF